MTDTIEDKVQRFAREFVAAKFTYASAADDIRRLRTLALEAFPQLGVKLEPPGPVKDRFVETAEKIVKEFNLWDGNAGCYGWLSGCIESALRAEAAKGEGAKLERIRNAMDGFRGNGDLRLWCDRLSEIDAILKEQT